MATPRPQAAKAQKQAARARKQAAKARYVVATFNRDKATELHALLALPGVTLVALSEWPGATSPDEHGATLLENAQIGRASCRERV